MKIPDYLSESDVYGFGFVTWGYRRPAVKDVAGPAEDAHVPCGRPGNKPSERTKQSR